jgi:signal peptidase II
MDKAAKKNISIIALTSSGLTLLDQLSKLAIVKYGDFTTNTGIAFSLKIPHLIILIMIPILLLLIVYIAYKELNCSKFITQISVSLLIAGGLGNYMDRLISGFVIDFVSIWKWPSFNLADTYITIGVLLIIIFYGKIKLIKTKKNG